MAKIIRERERRWRDEEEVDMEVPRIEDAPVLEVDRP